MSPKQFIDLWQNRSIVSDAFTAEAEIELFGRTGVIESEFFPPLITFKEQQVQNLHLPEETKRFLIEAGLPRQERTLFIELDPPEDGLKVLSQFQPHRVNNNLELPAIRYDYFYHLGVNSAGNDYGVEFWTGHLYLFGYGRSAFRKREPGVTVKTDVPVIDEHVQLWPTFVNTSVVHLAQMILVARESELKVQEKLLVEYLPKEQEELPFPVARRLGTALEKQLKRIDPAALYHPHSLWKAHVESLKSGLG